MLVVHDCVPSQAFIIAAGVPQPIVDLIESLVQASAAIHHELGGYFWSRELENVLEAIVLSVVISEGSQGLLWIACSSHAWLRAVYGWLQGSDRIEPSWVKIVAALVELPNETSRIIVEYCASHPAAKRSEGQSRRLFALGCRPLRSLLA